MGKDQLALSRGGITPRSARPSTTLAPRVAEDSFASHPLSVLALASSVRLEDPKGEHERVVMLEVAIAAGRDAARALDCWLSQSLTEYRGSRSAWDLNATTVELRMKLNRFEQVARDSADRLVALAPELLEAIPEYVSTQRPAKGKRRILEEVAVAASLLASIDSRSLERPPQSSTNLATGR